MNKKTRSVAVGAIVGLAIAAAGAYAAETYRSAQERSMIVISDHAIHEFETLKKTGDEASYRELVRLSKAGVGLATVLRTSYEIRSANPSFRQEPATVLPPARVFERLVGCAEGNGGRDNANACALYLESEIRSAHACQDLPESASQAKMSACNALSEYHGYILANEKRLAKAVDDGKEASQGGIFVRLASHVGLGFPEWVGDESLEERPS